MDLNKLATKIPQSVLDQIPAVMEKFNIDTPLRLAHFLAQCAHESGNFKVTTENLNYSKEGLMKVFKKYFPNEALAQQYEKKPNTIANRVYASRMGNGDEASQDGSKFKGRGFIQLTGKQNYTAFDKIVDDDILASPDLVASKYPLLSAAWFWDSRKINAVADKGKTDEDVKAVTKLVNGGYHGIDDRISKFKLFIGLLM
jgi:putative chitinase